MAEIPDYPPPTGPLDGSEVVLGFAGGATRRISSASLAALAIGSMTAAQLAATFGYVPVSAAGAAAAAPVQSVAGRYGTVVLVAGDVGLGNVDNTRDANKPVSAAQAAAIAAKYDAANPAGFVNASGAAAAAPIQSIGGKTGAVTLAALSLDQVNNTSDANKPVSTAQASAIAAKYDASNPSGFVNALGAAAASVVNARGSSTTQAPSQAALEAAIATLLSLGGGTLGSNGAISLTLGLNGASGSTRAMQFLTAGSPRWDFGVGDPESGGNSGSDIVFNRRDDNGSYLDTPFMIRRSDGAQIGPGKQKFGNVSWIDGYRPGLSSLVANTIAVSPNGGVGVVGVTRISDAGTGNPGSDSSWGGGFFCLHNALTSGTSGHSSYHELQVTVQTGYGPGAEDSSIATYDAPVTSVLSPIIPGYVSCRQTSVGRNDVAGSSNISAIDTWAPSAPILANTTAGSPNISNVSGVLGVGQLLNGPSIPAGTTVQSVSGSTAVMSANATATITGAQVQIAYAKKGVVVAAGSISPTYNRAFELFRDYGIGWVNTAGVTTGQVSGVQQDWTAFSDTAGYGINLHRQRANGGDAQTGDTLGSVNSWYTGNGGPISGGSLSFRRESAARMSSTLYGINEAGTQVGIGLMVQDNAFSPNVDNVISAGSAVYRLSVVYAGTPTINTSDMRTKMYAEDVEATDYSLFPILSPALCRAVLKCRLVQFKMVDAVDEKGWDAARWHQGAIFQEVYDNLVAEGAQALRLCLHVPGPMDGRRGI